MDYSRDFLHVDLKTYSKILECLKNNNKIKAIKALRDYTKGSLKDAKWAVDLLNHEKINTSSAVVVHREAKRILVGPQIIRVALDYGDGPVEIDMENMQLRALSELGRLGVHTCTKMLELVEIFEAIMSGKKIKIEDTDEGDNL